MEEVGSRGKLQSVAQGAQQGDAAETLNVLILDDSFADFDALRRALNRMDDLKASVSRAKTIEEARRLCAEIRFHIAFIDYDLGIESGLRFLQEIGGRGSSILPILVTGLPGAAVKEAALQAGAIGLVDKANISPTLLATTIRAACHAQFVENKLQQLISHMSRNGTQAPAAAVAGR